MSRFYNTACCESDRLKSIKYTGTKGSIMKTKGHATFTLKQWEEKPYLEMEDGAKLTKSFNIYTYEGDITGECHLEYLMAYNPDQSGSSVGIERIVGTLGGKTGSFVIQRSGTFSKDGVWETWSVVPGSATGEL